MHRASLMCGALLAVAAVSPAVGGPDASDGGFDVLPVRAPAADTKAVVRGNTAFALDVYDRLRAEPGNLIFSPISLTTALATATEGAAGATRREMAKVLHLRLPRRRLRRAFQSTLAKLAPDPDGGVQIDLANGVFADVTTRFRPGFRRALERRFGAHAESADFESDPRGAVRGINSWAFEKTRGLIPEILRVDDLRLPGGFVLTNAAYFQGEWARPFDEIEDGVFWSADGAIAVPLMSNTGEYSVAESEDLLTVEIPYRGDEASMVVLMPKGTAGLNGFEDALTPDALADALAALQTEHIVLHFPSFEIESRIGLQETLEALGMKRAFDRKKANFSRATKTRTAITSIGQTATIRVDQEGTVAAAVTSVSFVGAGQSFGGPRDVRIDRPFLLLVRHRRTDTILFMGRVEDPSARPD